MRRCGGMRDFVGFAMGDTCLGEHRGGGGALAGGFAVIDRNLLALATFAAVAPARNRLCRDPFRASVGSLHYGYNSRMGGRREGGRPRSTQQACRPRRPNLSVRDRRAGGGPQLVNLATMASVHAPDIMGPYHMPERGRGGDDGVVQYRSR